jgi:hypothetical protein
LGGVDTKKSWFVLLICLYLGFSIFTGCTSKLDDPLPPVDNEVQEELPEGKEKKLTQFGRAMDELGINIIFARSAQAKGRIERMWETLQSRLPVELALSGMKSIEETNDYLQTHIIPYFNGKWAVEAENKSIYVPLRADVDIDTILCVKEKRTTDNAGVFSFGNKAFQVVDTGFPLVPKGQRIEVLISLRIGIMVSYKGQIFQKIHYIKPIRGKKKKKIPRKVISIVKNHLKHGSPQWKEVWHSEQYDLSLKFLYDLFLADTDMRIK